MPKYLYPLVYIIFQYIVFNFFKYSILKVFPLNSLKGSVSTVVTPKKVIIEDF